MIEPRRPATLRVCNPATPGLQPHASRMQPHVCRRCGGEEAERAAVLLTDDALDAEAWWPLPPRHGVAGWQAPQGAAITLGKWLQEGACSALAAGIEVQGVSGLLRPHASYPTVGGGELRSTFVVRHEQVPQLRRCLPPFRDLCAAVEKRVQARHTIGRLGLEVGARARAGVALR